jgi:hypothetical protein
MRVLKKRESVPSLKNGVVKRVSPTAVRVPIKGHYGEPTVLLLVPHIKESKYLPAAKSSIWSREESIKPRFVLLKYNYSASNDVFCCCSFVPRCGFGLDIRGPLTKSAFLTSNIYPDYYTHLPDPVFSCHNSSCTKSINAQ